MVPGFKEGLYMYMYKYICIVYSTILLYHHYDDNDGIRSI